MTTEEHSLLREFGKAIRDLVDGNPPQSLPREPETGSPLSELHEAIAELLAKFAEAGEYLGSLSKGILDVDPPAGNQLISPLKQLHSNLRHLTWQAKQIAKGDLNLRVSLLGEFSESFNSLIGALRERMLVEEELRQAHGDLAQKEAEFRFMAENASDIIWRLDSNYCFTYVSPADERQRGFKAEEVIGKPVWSVVEPTQTENLKKLAAQRREKEERGVRTGTLTHLLELVRKNGDTYWTEANVNPLRDETGRLEGFVGLTRDISERKRAEEKRLELERRLLRAQKMESLGVLAGGVAHDFNNLLMGILGNLELALMDPSVGSRARTNLHRSIQACERAADLTRQMLAYSGKGKFVLTNVHLSHLVRESAELIKASTANSAMLSYDLDYSAPPIEADLGQIRQVVMNLITNASEAIGEAGGHISISTGVQESDERYLNRSRVDEKPPPGFFVYLQVSDTGCGMDEESEHRLFDPFFTTKFAGRGLGMSAVLGIVRAHGGAIFVNSMVGKGTTIRVLFPVAKDARVDTAKIEARDDPNAVDGVGSRPQPTVLLVDDEEVVREVCRDMLEYGGFRVLLAADGEEGLEVFRQYSEIIHCIILDLSMPRMDGLTAMSEIRKLRPDAKVILSSGYNQTEATRRYSGQGLAAFIQKPYQMQRLIDVLNQVLQSSE